MNIKQMFQKPIDRDIKSVIKVGQHDEDHVYQELDEYVVTNELQKHFRDFFHSYKKGITSHTDKMGVWISGFFGSGKSHFLKILSYLLQNKEVKGKNALSFFQEKIHDEKVLTDIERMCEGTTDVMLFNIDAKSDSDSKLHKDSILKVFNKVFNEMQGFCGSIPWVADLERQLVKEGVYESFKTAFYELSGGTSWIDAREDFYYEEDSIVSALAKTTKMSEEAARSWYNKSEENYSLSIEKFAQRVQEYIESKGMYHHVLFLVDEMGQYIGDDMQLMLNLQTVVEQLGIHTGGKCWVVVTSQKEIDSVTKVKGDDFSKIQGRFNTRLSLSSANVDEVIRKRILEKNETAKLTLQIFYSKKRSIMNNLISFKDTLEMKSYENEEDFIGIYPFVPYQFHLLQKVFTGIRIHGAAGKSLSEGERSLLSAFQESAIRFSKKEVGGLVPFSAFYETIESFLDASVRSVIIYAKQNSRLNDDDIELLKLLFLIKYVKEMPANIENIATLLAEHIDEDKVARIKQVQSSLQRLIRETLIQKNGEKYVFLTNDEQDVNREIKNMHVDTSEIIREIGMMIFEDIFAEKKYRYSTKYHLPFNTYIDDIPLRQQRHPFGIRVITAYYDVAAQVHEAELKLMSMRENNMIIQLSSSVHALEEMEQTKKIEAYLRKTSGTSSSSAIEEIKLRKRREVTERKSRVKTMLLEEIKEASFYVNNQLLKMKAKNPEERMNEASKVLVESLYSKLQLIKEHTDSVKDLHKRLEEQPSLIEEDANYLAIDEVKAYIKRNSQRNIPMTVKSITTYFTNIPYGWLELDIAQVLLKLWRLQDIKLILNQQVIAIDDRDWIHYVTKRDFVERVIVKEREKTPEKYVLAIKSLSKKLFNISAMPGDEDRLRKHFLTLLTKELDTVIHQLLGHYEEKPYPGKEVLENGKELFQKLLTEKDTMEWYKKAYELRNDFLDYAEDVIDVIDFFENQQTIFDDAIEKIQLYEKNKTYIINDEIKAAINEMKHIVFQKHPYNNIHRLPHYNTTFVEKYSELLEKECEPIRYVIQTDYQKVVDELHLTKTKNSLLLTVKERFGDLLDRLERVNNFFEAIAMKEESDRIKLRLFNEIKELMEKQQRSKSQKGVTKHHEHSIIEKKTINVSMTNVMHGATTIESEEDVEKLIEQLRKRLLEQLKKDTIIRLI